MIVYKSINNQIVSFLKEKGFKEEGKFLIFENDEDCFAYNTNTRTFSLTGTSGKSIDVYIKEFELVSFVKGDIIDEWRSNYYNCDLRSRNYSCLYRFKKKLRIGVGYGIYTFKESIAR